MATKAEIQYVHSLITVHVIYSVSLPWACFVDACTSPIATENQFNVHCTNVFTSAKIISSISIPHGTERKALVPMRMNMRFCPLWPLHTYTLKRHTNCMSVHSKAIPQKIASYCFQVRLCNEKKDRKMAAKTALCVCFKNKAQHLTLYEMWKITNVSHAAYKLQNTEK